MARRSKWSSETMAANETMLRFTHVAQLLPEKRDAIARRTDHREIYARYARDRAAEQAARCSQCGVPFCQIHCPLQNNIPDWLKLTAEGRLEEAFELSQSTNNFPEICGRICPQDRLCEGHCVIEKGFESVTIGAIERHITDTAWDEGWVKPIRPRRELASSIAIIGAGPAGLTAAEMLRRRGHQVHVYDRHDRAGGLLVYGIPHFKLDKAIVARRVAWLADGGVVFHRGTEIGRDVALATLRRRHDAVLIATGVYKARALDIPGARSAHVVKALDYLITAIRRELGDRVGAVQLDAKDRKVVVIGGGDTAMDCVRTAMRHGARSVTCLYRRDRANMPGSQREVAHAEEEGVVFEFLAEPVAITAESLARRRKGARASGAVEARRMRLGLADSSGRQRPEPIADSNFTLDADLVIEALGFEPENLPQVFDTPELQVTRQGTLSIDAKSMMTALPGVFAAGDIVRGASLVVWAIRDGREAAAAIHRFITANAHAAPFATAAE
jgi:glutamate synthase (NADPH/NADH) small chain